MNRQEDEKSQVMFLATLLQAQCLSGVVCPTSIAGEPCPFLKPCTDIKAEDWSSLVTQKEQ